MSAIADGAHVTDFSYTHCGQTAKPHEPHHDAPGPAPTVPAATPPENEELPKGVAWRAWLWPALLVIVCLICGVITEK